MSREHDVVRSLLAPAALGSASPAEIVRVEAHAEECPVCREDLARLREGVGVLAVAVPAMEPPARLKRDLMATVRSEAALRAPAGAPRRRRGHPADWFAALRSWPAAAAATAGLALVMIGWNVALQTRDDPAPRPEVTSLSVNGPGGIEGRVLYLPDEDQAIVSLARLPRADEDKGYELWVIRDDRPVSAGFLESAGPADQIAVASGVRGADALAVTLEPLSNRSRPTTTPIVQVDLPQRA